MLLAGRVRLDQGAVKGVSEAAPEEGLKCSPGDNSPKLNRLGTWQTGGLTHRLLRTDNEDSGHCIKLAARFLEAAAGKCVF